MSSEKKPEPILIRPVSTRSGQTAQNAIVTVSWPWEHLPKTADKLLQQGFREPAVVVAMTACETIVARAMTNGYKRRGVSDLEKPIDDLLSSYAIATNSKVLKLYKALTGDDQISQQPFWNDLQEAAKARNKTVHAGKGIPKKDAGRYIDAAKQAIEYIENVNNLRT